MESFKDNGGFTFVSLLLAVSVLIITLPFLTYLIQSSIYTSKYDEHAITHFFYFVRDDTILSTEYEIENNSIILHLQSEVVATISQYGQLVRRQVDDKGHEIYLRNVDHMEVENTPYGFKIFITTIKGEFYEKAFTFYK